MRSTKKRNFTEEETQDIIQRAKNGESRHAIMKVYNCSFSAVTKLLEANGVELVNYNDPEHRRPRNKYHLNEEYFDCIDTPNKAYILGFLFADGTNRTNRSEVAIRLQSRDEAILYKMRDEMGSSAPIYTETREMNGQLYDSSIYVMYGSHISARLEELGMIPRKSCKVEFPKEVPMYLMKDFLRGYVDGNGCIYWHEETCQYYFDVTTSVLFAHSLQEYFKTFFDIKSTITEQTVKNTFAHYTVYGKEQIYTVLHYLYNNSEMHLDRKYEKYLHIASTIG